MNLLPMKARKGRVTQCRAGTKTRHGRSARMTQVYMIANLTIEDADTYRRYETGFFPILKKYGGVVIVHCV